MDFTSAVCARARAHVLEFGLGFENLKPTKYFIYLCFKVRFLNLGLASLCKVGSWLLVLSEGVGLGLGSDLNSTFGVEIAIEFVRIVYARQPNQFSFS